MVHQLPVTIALAALASCASERNDGNGPLLTVDDTQVVPLRLELDVDGVVTEVGADAFHLLQMTGADCDRSFTAALTSASDGTPKVGLAFISPTPPEVGVAVGLGHVGVPPFDLEIPRHPSTFSVYGDPSTSLHAEATITEWAPDAFTVELGPGFLCHDAEGYDCDPFTRASLSLVSGELDLEPWCSTISSSPSGALCWPGNGPSDPREAYTACP